MPLPGIAFFAKPIQCNDISVHISHVILFLHKDDIIFLIVPNKIKNILPFFKTAVSVDQDL